MKKVKYNTLMVIRDDKGFVKERVCKEVEGYFIFVDDYRFFAYQSETKRWYIVDPATGISFVSADLLSTAKEETKLKIKIYEDIIKTEEYKRMVLDYQKIVNSDILPGQMSIYDL